MNIFQKTYGHLRTVIKHKYYVYKYARMCGITWRGLKHDMSKFNPIELFESIKYYSGAYSPIENCKADKGWSKAWFHHRGNNYHHYEMWIDNFDNGGQMLIMPFEECVEMLCDYLAAARTYSENRGIKFTFKSELDWWVNRMKLGRAMHSSMKVFLTSIFLALTKYEDDPSRVLKYECLKKLYEVATLDAEPEFIINVEENKSKVDNLISTFMK